MPCPACKCALPRMLPVLLKKHGEAGAKPRLLLAAGGCCLLCIVHAWRVAPRAGRRCTQLRHTGTSWHFFNTRPKPALLRNLSFWPSAGLRGV